ncbi:hypothetical protein DCO58_05255 [Helicobacter saguini]|uniref:Uncharacterized protein n=1 Tax=Helicobacter saguini TaxID=1548018 RepID=A0A347VT45_9HELI|nr:hypothetical protein [Helicobacter saguini]MWV62243.1 hypothetical protein [Helicobacter saguini]MWV67084.1 hypothetical protein [Helicobacter saguini]MWV69434.1 hypothetical protein [Helicobacter saguini]MWV71013.1 hypothetical protein [Helicobacter saguini]TLD91753.1 hypothetical protein LS64_011380 [Helicobacter saguini]
MHAADLLAAIQNGQNDVTDSTRKGLLEKQAKNIESALKKMENNNSISGAEIGALMGSIFGAGMLFNNLDSKNIESNLKQAQNELLDSTQNIDDDERALGLSIIGGMLGNLKDSKIANQNIESTNIESKSPKDIAKSILKDKDKNEMIEITKHIKKRFDEEYGSYAMEIVQNHKDKNKSKKNKLSIFGFMDKPKTIEQEYEEIKETIAMLSNPNILPPKIAIWDKEGFSNVSENEIRQICESQIEFALDSTNILNKHYENINKENEQTYKIVPLESIINYKKLDSNSSVLDLASELKESLTFEANYEYGFMKIASQEIYTTQTDMESELGLNGWRIDTGFELREAIKNNDSNKAKILYNKMIDIANEAMRLYNIFQKRWGEPQRELKDFIGFLADIKYDNIESSESIESTQANIENETPKANKADSIKSSESSESISLNTNFTEQNIEYLYEMHEDSPFGNALWKKLKFICGENATPDSLLKATIDSKKQVESSEKGEFFTLNFNAKDKEFINDEIYYKIESKDRPIHSLIKTLFDLRQNGRQTHLRLVKSYINDFLSAQDLALESIENVELEYDIYISATLLLRLDSISQGELEAAFKAKLPKAIMQNAKAILDSKIQELKSRKDSISQKIESIKLDLAFENYLKAKGSEMLKEIMI